MKRNSGALYVVARLCAGNWLLSAMVALSTDGVNDTTESGMHVRSRKVAK